MVRDGRIVWFGKGTPATPLSDPHACLDGEGCLALPGFINAHSRLSRTLARGWGLPQPDRVVAGGEFARFWERYDTLLDYDALRYAFLLAGLEAIRNGTTTIFDLLSVAQDPALALDAAAEAATQLGLRLNVSLAVSDRNGAEGGRRMVDDVLLFMAKASAYPLLSASMGLDSCVQLSDGTLSYAVGSAGIAQTGFHSVVGESYVAGLDCLKRFNMLPAVRLSHWGVLSRRTILTGALYCTAAERELLNRSGSWLVNCPRANLMSGSGTMPVFELLAEGQNVGLGSAWFDYDMPAEALAGASAQIYQCATDQAAIIEHSASFMIANNARLANIMLRQEIGALRVGAAADIILLRFNHLEPDDYPALLRLLLLGRAGWQVQSTVIGGELVYHNRRFVAIDDEHIRAHAREATLRLRAQF